MTQRNNTGSNIDTRMDRDSDPYRLYAIVRRDLQMDPLKAAAQAGHAYLDAYLNALDKRPQTIPLYKTDHGIKIAMTAKNLGALLKAYDQAREAGIPCALITDLGYTQFEGQPTITALGLGPAKKEEIYHITKRFQM